MTVAARKMGQTLAITLTMQECSDRAVLDAVELLVRRSYLDHQREALLRDLAAQRAKLDAADRPPALADWGELKVVGRHDS